MCKEETVLGTPLLPAKMAKEPLNPNNLVSRLLLEENRWITSRALKARF